MGQQSAARGRSGVPKPPKRKRKTVTHPIQEAACSAQKILVDWLMAQGYELTKETSNNVRLSVVRAVYARLALFDGCLVPTEGFTGLPREQELRDVFQAAIDTIEPCLDRAEALGWALQDLASKDDMRGRGAHFTPRSLSGPIVAKTLEPLLAVRPPLLPLFTPERILEMRICDPAVGGGVFLLDVVSQLADRLIECGWSSDVYVARRLVAIHCAYGVDVDPVSVECTKLAITLECRAYEMPMNWLDGNIKCGDALVGLKEDQFKAFHWKPSAQKSTDCASLERFYDETIAAGVRARRSVMIALSALAEDK